MRFINGNVQRWLMILLPPLSLLVCCVVIVPRQTKLRAINTKIRAAQAEVADYLQKLEEIRNLPPNPTVATLPMTNQEQSNFLRGLAQLCSRTGNTILSVDALAPALPSAGTAPPQSGSKKKDAQSGELPPEVLPIESTIKFDGDFQSLRAFLRSLQKSRRLISLSELKIGSGSDGFPALQCQLTITRYVDTPEHLLPKPAEKKKS